MNFVSESEIYFENGFQKIETLKIVYGYRHKILTFQLQKQKLFRFDHISIGNVGKTE